MAIGFEFKPDERINEGSLATALGTSRTPLREALNRLVAEGFLTFRTGRGFFCRTLDPDGVFDLYEARRAIEAEGARLAAERASDADLVALLAHLDATEQDYTGGTEAKRLVDLDEDFHLRVIRLSGNAEMERILRNLNARSRYIRWIDMEDRHLVTPADHRAIAEALKRRDGTEAASEMARHIERRRDEATDAVRRAFSRLYVPQ